MVVRDILMRIIRAPGRSCKSFKIALVVLPLNLVFFLIAFSSDRWLLSLNTYNIGGVDYSMRNQGLWRYCQKASGLQCCANINDVVSVHGQSVPAFLNATRAFMTIGLISQVTCLLVLFSSVLCFGNDDSIGNSSGKCAIVVLNLITVACVFLSIIIYGAAYPKHDWTSQYELSWTYGFAVTSGIIHFFSIGAYCYD